MSYLSFLQYLDNVIHLDLTFYAIFILQILVKGVYKLWQLFTK